MMNIEDWLASATDELLEARAGLSVGGTAYRWSNIKERFDYITSILQVIAPEGIDPVIERINEATHNAEVATANANEATENANTATARADDAAELIENMTISAQTLPAGQQASIVSWQKLADKYSLVLGIPTTKIAEVTATQLAPGTAPTATLENIDAMNLRLNLGLPLAKPIDVVKTYSSVAALQAGIRNDVPVGYYAIVANSVTNEDNGRIYIRTNTAPYYSFITDISAATPEFHMGTINVVDADETAAAAINVADPSNPVLNLTIPAKPVINTIDTRITNVGTQASSTISGSADDLTLQLIVPAIPQFQEQVVVTNDESATGRASGTITGTSENLVLSLNIPPDINAVIASANKLGSVKVGDTLSINAEGVLNVGTVGISHEFSLATSDWQLVDGYYTITKSNLSDVASVLECVINLDESYYNLKSDLIAETGNRSIVFKTEKLPSGVVKGKLYLYKLESGGVI